MQLHADIDSRRKELVIDFIFSLLQARSFCLQHKPMHSCSEESRTVFYWAYFQVRAHRIAALKT